MYPKASEGGHGIWPKHVAPDFTPVLERWGDPVPLIWDHETYDEWVAWTPMQILTRFLDGKEIVWHATNGGYYRPAETTEEERQGLTQEPGIGLVSPYGGQYASLASDWREFDNEARWVKPSALEIAIDGRSVAFEARHIFPCLHYAHKVTSSDDRPDVERVCGPIGPAQPFDWLRPNDDPECSRWPCHVKISPDGIDMSDADGLLLAPSVPTPDKVDRERARRGKDRPIRDCESFVRDLCQSGDLLRRIRGDDFAYAFLGVIESEAIWYSDGTRLTFGGEDSAGYAVASLRPFREHFRTFAPHSGHDYGPDLFNEIAALLGECGYIIGLWDGP